MTYDGEVVSTVENCGVAERMYIRQPLFTSILPSSSSSFLRLNLDATRPLLYSGGQMQTSQTCFGIFADHSISTFYYLTTLIPNSISMGKTLVVFDFDWSFVDQDTDRWVLEVLSTPLRRLLQTRKSGGSQCTPDVV